MNRLDSGENKSLFSAPIGPLKQNEAMKMSMPAKSAQTKSARGASVSGKFARAKSAPPTRNKSAAAARKEVQPPEWEDDEFDRAIAKALKSGALDEMIAQAVQDKRDGKTLPL